MPRSTLLPLLLLVPVALAADPAVREKARAGDPAAFHALGLDAARSGKDDAAAARWFRLAAEQGHAPAQAELARLHEQGRGVPKSDLDAFVFLSLAARQKDADVLARRDRLGVTLTDAQRVTAARRVAAAEALVAVHPRRFGTAANVETVRGWYIWRKFDADTWQAEVARENDGQVFQVRVLPWATTYRHLVYGARPDALLSGERVNAFFAADENHPRGYLTHFQDEIGQMKGHGHSWQLRAVAGRGFTAVAVAGDKPLDGKELAFELDPACKVWKAGKAGTAFPYAAGDRVLLTWVLRGERRVAVLVTDDASLEAIKKGQAEQLDKETAAEGVAGRVQSVESDTVHLMVFATYWSQAGRLKEKQAVRLVTTEKGFRPSGNAVAAEVMFRQNRGVYGSGPSDVLLRLKDAADAERVRGWDGVVRLVAQPGREP